MFTKYKDTKNISIGHGLLSPLTKRAYSLPKNVDSIADIQYRKNNKKYKSFLIMLYLLSKIYIIRHKRSTPRVICETDIEILKKQPKIIKKTLVI